MLCGVLWCVVFLRAGGCFFENENPICRVLGILRAIRIIVIVRIVIIMINNNHINNDSHHNNRHNNISGGREDRVADICTCNASPHTHTRTSQAIASARICA